ncbi:MAG: hypothetical protein JWO36_1162 [Myxococcales bacterium]|nr:hypothetical protein [Myxococcales bacterium]
MKGKALVIAAAALLAGLVGLWLAMRTTEDSPSARASDSGSQDVIVGNKPPGTVTAPALPAGSGSAVQGEDGARSYVVGGVQIRDHRGGDQKPIDLPPNIHPPESRQLPSELTHAISQKVKQVMMECTADVPREARGPGPRLEGQIIVGIKDQKITISKATMQLRDVVGAAVEPTKACIEHKAIGLQAAAADQADMESYSINLTFAIP